MFVYVFARAGHSLRRHPNNDRTSFAKLCINIMALEKAAEHFVLISRDRR